MKNYPLLRLSAILLGSLLSGCQIAFTQEPNSVIAPTKSLPYVWRNVEINGGGFISGLIFSPKERGLIYARTDIGGAYRWNAQTNRWIPLTDIFGPDDWNLLGIESIAPDPNDANRVYVAAGTYTNDWAGNGAILRSDDRGNTWKRTDLPFKNGGNEDGRGMGERLVVDPQNSQILYFGSRRAGLWKSGDYGATWNKVKTFPVPKDDNNIGIAFVTFDGNGAIYAGVASKTANLFVSKDKGATWLPVAGAPQGLMPHHGVFASDGTFYLSYSNAPGPNGATDGAVWKRDKAGVWTNISPITPNAEHGFGFAGLSVSAQNPRIVMVATLDRWAQGDDIFRSTDGGATWKSVKANGVRDASAAPYLKWGKPEADIGHWFGSLEIDPFDASHVIYGTGATSWGSDDVAAVDEGKTSHWTVRAAGIEETSVGKLISPHVGPHLISAMRDIGGFVHDDLTVSPRAGMLDNPRMSRNEGLDFAGQKPTIIARSGDDKGGYSLDSGKIWTEFTSYPPEKMGGGSIVVSADGASFVWPANVGNSKDGNTYFTRDNGAAWTKSVGLPAKANLVADRVAPETFYCFDKDAKNLLVSTDGGATFAPHGAAITDDFSRLNASPHAQGDLWLAGKAGLTRSLDGGSTWTKFANVESADNIGFGKAAPDANYEALYLSGKIGGVQGVFRSDDEGQSWTRINDNRHQWGWIGAAITGDPRVYGRVFLSTNGRGIIWGELAPAQ